MLADWRAQAARRLPELHELTLERADRQGELAFLLEPDLKEARGGLRDVTVLRAVAASWLADAPRDGWTRARTRLLDVRDALHLVTGRATDRLSLQEQDQVAGRLGLLDADTLLRQVYEAARTVAYASDVTWREVAGVLRSREPPQARTARPLAGPSRPPTAARSPTASSNRTARWCWPAPPTRTRPGAAAAGRRRRRAGRAARLAVRGTRARRRPRPPLPVPWPAEARDAAGHPARRRASPPCRSGRRWRPRA